jgi:hypothetical protein
MNTIIEHRSEVLRELMAVAVRRLCHLVCGFCVSYVGAQQRRIMVTVW